MNTVGTTSKSGSPPLPHRYTLDGAKNPPVRALALAIKMLHRASVYNASFETSGITFGDLSIKGCKRAMTSTTCTSTLLALTSLLGFAIRVGAGAGEEFVVVVVVAIFGLLIIEFLLVVALAFLDVLDTGRFSAETVIDGFPLAFFAEDGLAGGFDDGRRLLNTQLGEKLPVDEDVALARGKNVSGYSTGKEKS